MNTALPNNSQEFSFRNDMLIFNGINYAFNEKISILITLPVTSLSTTQNITTLGANVIRKFNINEKLNSATSLTISGIISETSTINLSQIWTYGDNNKNITGGIGYIRSMGTNFGLLSDNLYFKLGGIVEINDYFSAIAENLVFVNLNHAENGRFYGSPIPIILTNNADFISSIGVRGKINNLAIDLAYSYSKDLRVQSRIPVLGYFKLQYFLNVGK